MGILIHDPINSKQEIEALIVKYKSVFDTIQFKLKMIRKEDPQRGNCDTLYIKHK